MGRQWISAALMVGVLIAGRAVARTQGSEMEVVPAPRVPVSSFIMTIDGSSHIVAVGEAKFRRSSSTDGAEFSLELGSTSHDAAILFARSGSEPMQPGIYPVDDRPGGPALHALVVTGSPLKPSGVYRAQAGTLTMRATGGGQLEGTFDLRALGFTAERPQREQMVITVAGSFMATER